MTNAEHGSVGSTPPTGAHQGQARREWWRSPAVRLAGAAALLASGWTAAIVFDLTPALRGPAEWRWELYQPLHVVPVRLIPPLAIAVLIGAWSWRYRERRQPGIAALLALVVLACGFRVTTQWTSPTGIDIVGRVMNPAYMSCFGPAMEVEDVDALLRDYAERRDELSYRQLTHPPGNTLYFRFALSVAEHLPGLVRLAHPVIERRRPGMEPWFRSYGDTKIVAGAIAGVGVLVLACLTTLPLYYLARRLDGPWTAAMAVALFAVMPAGTMFMPVVDGLQTLCVATAALLAVEGIVRSRGVLVAAGGTALGASTFLSYAGLPAALALVLVLAVALVESPRGYWRAVAGRVAFFTLGFVLPWVVYWVGWGVDPVRLLFLSQGQNHNAWMRSYWLWLVYNPYDLALFAGAAVTAAFAVSAIGMGSRLARKRGLDLTDSMLWAMLAAGAALLISGGLRGETARTLLYAFPFVAWAAATTLRRAAGDREMLAGVVIGLTAVQTLIMHAALRVYH